MESLLSVYLLCTVFHCGLADQVVVHYNMQYYFFFPKLLDQFVHSIML